MKTRRAHPDETVQVLRERVFAPPLVSDRKSVLLPGAIKERYQPVVEGVEEIAQRPGLRLQRRIREQLRPLPRQHSEGARKPHERDPHGGRRLAGVGRVGGRRDVVHLARRKGHRYV